MVLLTGLTLFISSMALFIYQMLWMRLLGFTEDTSIATTLVALFVGMALGSLLTQWRLKHGLNGLKAFIFTQLLIAVSAPLLLPQLISPEQIEFLYGDIALFLILLIPSAALGMTFPLLTSWLATYKPNNHSVSFFYGLMLLGGATGLLLNGFYIVPMVGLNGAIYSAAGLNLFAALIALYLYLKTKPSEFPPPLSSPSKTHTTWQPFTLLIILSLIGFVTMGSSVIWSKLISLYTGTTLFSLTAILTTLFLGSALGALFINLWQNRQKLDPKHLFILLVALFIVLNLTRYLFSESSNIYSSSQYLGELLNHSDALFFAFMVFIPSLLFGAITALTLTLYCQIPYKIQQKIGMAYSLLLLTTIAGGVVTALWLIPELGSSTTLLIFATTPLLLSLLVLPKINPLKNKIIRYALLGVLGIASLFIPSIHFPDLFKQHYYRYIDYTPPIIDFSLKEGKAGVIGFTLHEMKSSRIKINGLTQSKVLVHRPYKGESSEILAGALPYLLQENATNALVLGFQTGITTRILAKSDLEGVVKTIEPEPKIVEAMMVLNLLVNFPFLEDGRVNIEYNGFRAALKEDSEYYSIITTQAPYAWLTGATQLYSQEFFNLVKMRLKENGIFSYHFSLLRIDTQTLKSILKTFYSVFPTGAVFSDLRHGNLILLGGNKPLIMDFEKTQNYYKIEAHYESASAAEMLRFSGVRTPQELSRTLLFSSEKINTLVKEAKIIIDANLLIEARIEPLSKKMPKGENDPYEFIKQAVQKNALN